MNTKKRPTSVTVIGWILTVLGGLGVVTAVASLFSEGQPLESIDLLIVAIPSLAGTALTVVSGIAILEGLNWGRLLYLFIVPVQTVLQALAYGLDSIGPVHVGGFIFYIVILVLLTRPAASTFFASGSSGAPKLDE